MRARWARLTKPSGSSESAARRSGHWDAVHRRSGAGETTGSGEGSRARSAGMSSSALCNRADGSPATDLRRGHGGTARFRDSGFIAVRDRGPQRARYPGARAGVSSAREAADRLKPLALAGDHAACLAWVDAIARLELVGVRSRRKSYRFRCDRRARCSSVASAPQRPSGLGEAPLGDGRWRRRRCRRSSLLAQGELSLWAGTPATRPSQAVTVCEPDCSPSTG